MGDVGCGMQDADAPGCSGAGWRRGEEMLRGGGGIVRGWSGRAAAYKPGDEKGERPRQARTVRVINGGERRVRPLLPESHKMAK